MTEATPSMAGAGRLDGSHACSRVASVAVQPLAVSVLSGFDHPGLRSGITGQIATNPVTANTLILASIALLQLTESGPASARLAARLCAATMALAALLCPSRWLTLAQVPRVLAPETPDV